MGKWGDRPQRRFYRLQRAHRSPPPSYHIPERSFPEYCNDGVPLWEKKFCTLVGLVSWRKIVDVQMSKSWNVSNIVLDWDDSAGKEAFQNAKKIYWAEINGRHCDISFPSPDIYIDQINWNPDIDPELIKDLEEREFKAEDLEEQESTESAALDKYDYHTRKVDNPWESSSNVDGGDSAKDKRSWGHWDGGVAESGNSNGNDDPWNCDYKQGNKASYQNTWENRGDKSQDFNKWENHGTWERDYGTNDNRHNRWEHGCSGTGSTRDKGWGQSNSNSWTSNQNESQKVDNGGNPWVRADGTHNNQPWGNSRGDGRSWRKHESHSVGRRELGVRKNNGDWEGWNGGCRKREGSDRYMNGYKNSRYHKDDDQTGQFWGSGKANKRVNFAR